MEGWEGAGERREEGMEPRGAVDRLRGPWDVASVSWPMVVLPVLPSPKGKREVMTGMAEWGCGVWGGRGCAAKRQRRGRLEGHRISLETDLN